MEPDYYSGRQSMTDRLAMLSTSLSDDQANELAELAFTATEHGLSDNIAPIFDLLIRMYPDNAAGYVGRSYVRINDNDNTGALEELEPEALSAETNAEMAWSVRLYLLRLRDGPSVNAYLYPQIEAAIGTEALAEVTALADELMGTVDDGETVVVHYFGLPRWVRRRS